ncbi:hypothetical protein AcW1_005411 [Taiwanofungus camphoratus]|nr:hypothetical protein AcW1_005411 [Antrodia cinnamomea]
MFGSNRCLELTVKPVHFLEWSSQLISTAAQGGSSSPTIDDHHLSPALAPGLWFNNKRRSAELVMDEFSTALQAACPSQLQCMHFHERTGQ